MIYRLLRREMVTNQRTPQLISSNETSESHFIEQISRFIKLVKKKQDLYMRIQGESVYAVRPNFQQPYNYIKEFQKYLEQGASIHRAIDTFRGESFFASKTYHYTAFMRIRQVLELETRRFKAQGNRELQLRFEQVKTALTELYNTSVYQQSYDLNEIIAFINKDQNSRIAAFFPKKTSSPLEPLNSSKKLLQKLKNPNMDKSGLRKTLSVQLGKSKQSKLQTMINKKLIVQQLATEKRIQQRKRVKPKTINLFKLYDILEVKGMPVDRSGSFKQQLQQNMLDRNNKIREEIKNWEKKYLLFKYCRKTKK